MSPSLQLAAIEAGAEAEPSVDVSVGLWAGLGTLVVLMLVFDLLIFARGGEPTVRQAVGWSIGWTAVAAAFGAWMWITHGAEPGEEFIAGYLLERSLSFDNLFVFAVIFSFFAVPAALQSRVLALGIALALVLRLVFIVLGAILLGVSYIYQKGQQRMRAVNE